MSKEEVILVMTDINPSLLNDINAKLADLPEDFNEFTSKYDKVYSGPQQYKSFNFHLLTRIITGKMSAIQEDVLEESVCNALSLTRVNFVPDDLHACHQMKRSGRVIVTEKH